MEKNLDWKREFLEIMKILQNNGVDLTAISTRYSKEGKRYFTTLKDIQQKDVDIESIIVLNKLNENYKIGHYLNNFRAIYNGSHEGNLLDEERKSAEELGIVKKVSTNRQKPIFKGGKISQFHIDIVKANITKILEGELNTKEVITLINEKAIKVGETQIIDNGTIKRIVEIILAGKPEELKKYNRTLQRIKNETLKNKRGNKKKREQDLEYVSKVINDYLPKLISGEMTLDMIANELKTSPKTVNIIIEGYYLKSNDEEGLRQYKESKKRNQGTSIEKRIKAKEMRKDVALHEVVSNAEFLLLSEEEQDNQIIMKIRQEQLKEEKNREKSGNRVTTEKTTEAAIQRIKDYFRSKNDYDKGIQSFSEQDIRYMIFRYPTITSRDAQTLDEKFDVLTSYDDINEQTAYGMAKTFPAIMGYAADRTKSQLDLLQKENLIDNVVNTPSGLMRSVGLMYALIQYAKERHKTNDLSNITRSNIFMSNTALKRLYGVTYDELKERFPYGERTEEDVSYIIGGEDIGKATYDAGVKEADQAFRTVSQLTNEKTKWRD